MLEVVKDLLYEAYVRSGRLQQAIMVRRFFLDETGTDNVTPITSASFRLGRPEAAGVAEYQRPANCTPLPRAWPPRILHVAE